MTNRAFICGFEGLSLSDVERAFIARYRPWGAILFARNVEFGQRLQSSDPRELIELQNEIATHYGEVLLLERTGTGDPVERAAWEAETDRLVHWASRVSARLERVSESRR